MAKASVSYQKEIVRLRAIVGQMEVSMGVKQVRKPYSPCQTNMLPPLLTFSTNLDTPHPAVQTPCQPHSAWSLVL